MATTSLKMNLGSNFGDLLVQTAKERLLCDGDIEGALDVLIGGIDCDKEQAIQLLYGEMFLVVSEDKTYLDGVMYDPNIHTDRELFNSNEWCREMYHLIVEEFKTCKRGLDNLSRHIMGGSEELIAVKLPHATIAKAFMSKSPLSVDVMESVNNDVYNNIYGIIDDVEEFVGEYYPKAKVIKWLFENMPDRENISPLYPSAIDLLLDLQNQVSIIKNGNAIVKDNTLEVELENRLKYAPKIKEAVSKGLEPVDINSNWSAGWLSPTGEFYGLNGSVSNRLHNTIADALIDNGVIPEEYSDNPDNWLETEGWVKIHGKQIQFSGWLLYLNDKPNKSITDIQKKLICEYGKSCHNGVLELGFNNTEVKVRKLSVTETPMWRQYFV